MHRRVALAAALVVLTVLVGGRWVATRHGVVDEPPVLAGGVPAAPAPTADAQPTPTATPTPTQAPQPTTAPRPVNRSKSGPLGTMSMTGRKAVALTFDDGPHPEWTPQVLDRLKAAGVKAMFCVVGSQVRKYPALIRRIVREGHTLCNHTWNHELDLGKQPEAKIKANLEATNREIRRAVPDARITYFRHPGGAWTPRAIKVASDLGMRSIDWDVDPRDWEITDAKTIGRRVLDHARPGSIVLLHDGGGDRKGTLAACPGVINTLKQRYGIMRLR